MESRGTSAVFSPVYVEYMYLCPATLGSRCPYSVQYESLINSCTTELEGIQTEFAKAEPCTPAKKVQFEISLISS